MGKITGSSTLFTPELTTEVFSKVKGHSTLARLCAAMPMNFAGTDQFVFSMDGEVAIVGEGANKPAGNASFAPVTIKPIKIVYQHRITDEFVKLSNEKQIPYLKAFSDGFSKKIARGIDIIAIHGVNPYDGADSAIVGDNCFARKVVKTVNYNSTAPDDNIDDAAGLIQTSGGIITGIAIAPIMGAELGRMKNGSTKQPIYPEFRYGNNPGSFGGMKADVNNTVSFGESNIRAVIGDFENAFRWGFAEEIPLEIIEFGDPDGQGDLKRMNQVVLRAEAYIGWGILDASSFAMVVVPGSE